MEAGISLPLRPRDSAALCIVRRGLRNVRRRDEQGSLKGRDTRVTMPLPHSRFLTNDAWEKHSADALGEFANLPLLERLNDRLADAMIAIDEAVQMCELEGDTTYQASLFGPQILAVYDQVNCIMKKISD